MPELTAYTENELLRKLASGDQQALAHIYATYWRKLFLQAYNVLKDKSQCEDIVQEIFFQLWRKRTTIEITDTLGGYLYAATRYHVFHAIRRSTRKQHFFNNIQERMLTPPADEDIIAKNLQHEINRAVSVLPDKCRTIYKLSREELLSHREIAERLHISIKTVENQLTIALRRLRVYITQCVLLLISYVN